MGCGAPFEKETKIIAIPKGKGTPQLIATKRLLTHGVPQGAFSESINYLFTSKRKKADDEMTGADDGSAINSGT